MLDLSRELQDLTADLVAINSVIGNEKEIADEISEIFTHYGLNVLRAKDSVVARLELGKEKTIALIGHLDTVPESRENQTIAKIENGNLIGLGTCDMKNGIACALKILHDIKNGAINATKNIVFVFYDGEEGPLPNGITRLLEANALHGIDFAYILEPTCSKYSVGCLGAINATLEIDGIAAHSANPKLGKNAIYEAMKIIEKIREADAKLIETPLVCGLSAEGDTARPDGRPLSGYETMNVTQIKTENASNVIPPKVTINVNYRFSPERSVEDATNFLYSIVDKSVVTKISSAASSLTDAKKSAEFLQDGIEKEIMQAWTDIAQLNAAGIPAINFGAADIKLAHKPDEYVNIADLKNFYEKLKKHV